MARKDPQIIKMTVNSPSAKVPKSVFIHPLFALFKILIIILGNDELENNNS
jgi:hypothetical protein